MIVWLIALLLLGVLALVGYYQGVIKVAASLVGLFFAALLALPLSPVIKPVLPVFGVKHPLWSQVIPPLIIFLIILIIFKIVGYAVSKKVDVYYKYKTDDKTAIKWERVSSRTGMALGVVNGAIYFVLVMIPIYVASYLTAQVASGDQDPAGVRFLNAARAQMHGAKVDKVVAAYDPAPTNFYTAADIVGLLKINPLLNSRLSRYPVFLSLGERKEFQDLANDLELQRLIQTQAKISDIINYPKVQVILTNAALVNEIGKLISSDLGDLHEYLLTGKSAKYDEEKILGLWTLNFNATAAQEKISNPKITPFQLNQLKQTKYAPVRGMTFIATTDKRAILKKPAGKVDAPATVLAEGTWAGKGSGYEVTLGKDSATLTIEGGKIFMPRDGMTLVFEKEL